MAMLLEAPLLLALVASLPVATVGQMRGGDGPLTCNHRCDRGVAAAGEVIGAKSRCFEGKYSNGNKAYGCFQVDCMNGHEGEMFPSTAAPTSYRVTLSDGRSCECKGKGYMQPYGWKGMLMCESIDAVCPMEMNGSMMQPPEMMHRDRITEMLMQDYGDTMGQQLLNYFDRGMFNPHTAAEGAIANKWLVSMNCPVGQWAVGMNGENYQMVGAMSVEFPAGDVGRLVDSIVDGCVSFVEQDMWTQNFSEYKADLPWMEREMETVMDFQTQTPWGIDSIDGRMDGRYTHEYSGRGVTVFVVDTGVDSDHEELRGRVDRGQDFTDDRTGTEDRQGHGTHCAGSVAGTNVGVAPDARIVALKVLDDSGRGRGSYILNAVNFLLQEKQRRDRSNGGPMVVSASLGGGRSTTLNRAFGSLVTAGITTVVAAGNENTNAQFASPASQENLITVGAIDRNNRAASFSNFGFLIDIWGPGVQIVSARTTGGLTTLSGTSMACPHVSGVAALLLERNPSYTPADIHMILTDRCREDLRFIKQSTGEVLRTFAAVQRPELNCPVASRSGAASTPGSNNGMTPGVGDQAMGRKVLMILAAMGAVLAALWVATYCFKYRKPADVERAGDSIPGRPASETELTEKA